MLDHDDSGRPERQSAIIDRELLRYRVDVAALSETRLKGHGQLTEKNYTFLWSGSDQHQTGVAFAIHKDMLTRLADVPSALSNRLSCARIRLAEKRFLTLVDVNAPTMTYDDATRANFYADLGRVLSNVPKSDKLIVLGDFNARVGSDCPGWGRVLGTQARGRTNSNGSLLLELCTELDLAITNTFFAMADKWYYSWMHPRSRAWHLLDFILVRRDDLRDIKSTRVMRGATYETDHLMVRAVCNLRIAPVRRKRARQPLRKLDVSLLQQKAEDLVNKVSDSTNQLTDHNTEDVGVNERWGQISSAVYAAAKEVLGHPRRRHADWFDQNDADIEKLMAEVRVCRQQALSGVLQRATRRMKNEWWDSKAEELQGYADAHMTRAFYDGLKAVYGLRHSGSNPVLSADGATLHTTPEEVLRRWKEHFQQLLNRPSTVDSAAIERLEQRPTREDLDGPPTLDELQQALKSLKAGKTLRHCAAQ
ncbi:Hypp8770 [Branchiostoma lanceolatum]|uniref:Hypp8770 protein n=1 Tax=Branchiostoma lanceolatum TaxID=7740 RepID=A0A8J9ZA49_BRALA|nr:Hypp8770 [Branchiostoma lanceolatum]